MAGEDTRLTSLGKELFGEEFEEVKRPSKKDSVVLTNGELNEQFKLLAKVQKDEQVKESYRTEAPTPPWRILFAGSKDTVSVITTGCNFEPLERAKEDKNLVRAMLSINEDLDHSRCIRNYIEGTEYPEEKFNEMVENFQIDARKNLYHIMVVCAENPKMSNDIVARLREYYGLRHEEGFRMPYVLIGNFSNLSEEERTAAWGRGVTVWDPKGLFNAEIQIKINELFKKSIEYAYNDKEPTYTIMVMGDSEDFSAYEKLQKEDEKAKKNKQTRVLNYNLNFKHVTPDKQGYEAAKESLKREYVGSVIIHSTKDGINQSQQGLAIKVANEPLYKNILLASIGEKSKEAGELGARWYSDMFSFEEKIKKIATDIDTRSRRFILPEAAEAKIELYGTAIVRYDSSGKAFESKRKSFDATVKKPKKEFDPNVIQKRLRKGFQDD